MNNELIQIKEGILDYLGKQGGNLTIYGDEHERGYCFGKNDFNFSPEEKVLITYQGAAMNEMDINQALIKLEKELSVEGIKDEVLIRTDGDLDLDAVKKVNKNKNKDFELEL